MNRSRVSHLEKAVSATVALPERVMRVEEEIIGPGVPVDPAEEVSSGGGPIVTRLEISRKGAA